MFSGSFLGSMKKEQVESHMDLLQSITKGSVEIKAPKTYVSGQGYVVDAEAAKLKTDVKGSFKDVPYSLVSELVTIGMDVTLSGQSSPIGSPDEVFPALAADMRRLNARLQNLFEKAEADLTLGKFVCKTDLGLLLVREIKMLQDSLVDEVQEHLYAGWSILAIVVQNDQRNPDYILGRKGDVTT